MCEILGHKIEIAVQMEIRKTAKLKCDLISYGLSLLFRCVE